MEKRFHTVMEDKDAVFVGMLIIKELVEDGEDSDILEKVGEERIVNFYNAMDKTSQSEEGFGTAESQKETIVTLLDNLLTQLGH